jgi:cytochrome c oxidase subunit I
MSTTGASVLAAAYLLPPVYLIWSLLYGKKAGDNPWGATGLEWTTPSPPPTHNFRKPAIVETGPYGYHDIGSAPEPGPRAPHRAQG